MELSDLPGPSPFKDSRSKMLKLFFYYLCCICFLLNCITEYNPFEDASNAKIYIIERSFQDNDTIEIFSNQNFKISLALKEKIDSFTISIDDECLIRDTKNDGFAKEYDINFSIFDTGKKEINCKVYREQREPYSKNLPLYSISPLQLDTLKGCFGKVCTLTIAGVQDPGVYYHWNFGYRNNLKMFSKQLNFTPNPTTVKNYKKGSLWVSDKNLEHRSPSINFLIIMADTSKPIITNIFNNNSDTIKTADSSFIFKVQVTGQSKFPVDSASINGVPFDTYDRMKNIYSYTINNMHSYTVDPFIAHVYAIGNKDSEPKNDTNRTFYFYFDESIDPTDNTILTIEDVQKDTLFTQLSFITIFFNVISRNPLPLTVKATINQDTIAKEFDFPNGIGSEQFEDIKLKKDTINILIITAIDSTNKIMAKDSRIIWHKNDLDDLTNPFILEIKVDNKIIYPDEPFAYTPNDTAQVKVVAYDNVSGIDYIVIGLDTLFSDSIIWTTTLVNLKHNPHSDEIPIKAVDKFGNDTITYITVIQNTLPYLVEEELRIPSLVRAGNTYIDTLKLYDDEGDLIKMKFKQYPKNNFSFDTITNSITWTPPIQDTGIETLSVQLYNPEYSKKEFSETFMWVFTIKDTINIGPPIKLATNSDDFPPYLEFNKQPLRIRLAIENGTGTEPYIYNAYITKLDTFLLKRSFNDSLVWIPKESDTGDQQLFITVVDEFSSDSLFHIITVTPENSYKCSCYVEGEYVHKDTLDLRGITDTTILAKLEYTIIDKDHPLTEEYLVSVKRNEYQTTFNTDSTKFSILIKPKHGNKDEILMVNVQDKTGASIDINLRIVHPSFSKNVPKINDFSSIHKGRKDLFIEIKEK